MKDPDGIRSMVAEKFSPEDVEEVLRVLRGAWAETWMMADTDEVLRAIVKLGAGDLDRTRYYASLARIDFRGVLLWAGYV